MVAKIRSAGNHPMANRARLRKRRLLQRFGNELERIFAVRNLWLLVDNLLAVRRFQMEAAIGSPDPVDGAVEENCLLRCVLEISRT